MNTLKESWEGLLRLLNKKSRELNAMKILKSKCCPNLMLRTASKTHLNQQKSCNLLSQPWKNTQNVSKMGDGKFKQGLLLLFQGTHFYCLGKKKHHFFKETNSWEKNSRKSRDFFGNNWFPRQYLKNEILFHETKKIKLFHKYCYFHKLSFCSAKKRNMPGLIRWD